MSHRLSRIAASSAVLEGRIGTRLGNADDHLYALAVLDGDGVMPEYNDVPGNGTVQAAAFTLDPSGPLAGTPGTPSNP